MLLSSWTIKLPATIRRTPLQLFQYLKQHFSPTSATGEFPRFSICSRATEATKLYFPLLYKLYLRTFYLLEKTFRTASPALIATKVTARGIAYVWNVPRSHKRFIMSSEGIQTAEVLDSEWVHKAFAQLQNLSRIRLECPLFRLINDS